MGFAFTPSSPSGLSPLARAQTVHGADYRLGLVPYWIALVIVIPRCLSNQQRRFLHLMNISAVDLILSGSKTRSMILLLLHLSFSPLMAHGTLGCAEVSRVARWIIAFSSSLVFGPFERSRVCDPDPARKHSNLRHPSPTPRWDTDFALATRRHPLAFLW